MSDTLSIAPRDLEIAQEFTREVAKRLGGTGFEVRIFGSRARGDADTESDLDLFVSLSEDDPSGAIEDNVTQLATDLTLKHGITVSVVVADPTFREQHRGYAFLQTVEREGVPV